MNEESARLAPSRILIVRLGSLGDLIHTLPALAALREQFPNAEIDWVVERAHAGLLAMVPGLSQVVVLADRSAGGWWKVIRALRARRYDVAFDLQGLVKSAAIARFSGAARVAGFAAAALREPAARFFYTETVEVPRHHHVIQKNLKMTSGVFFTDGDARRHFQFPLAEPNSPALDALRAEGVGEFAVINPGAAWPNKRWPPASFGAVAKFIHASYGWTPVVLWGPGEQAVAESIRQASGGVARVAPETTLADLVAIARAARLFVSGDTGPLHIAGATGTPIVALFGPTSPARNGPWDDRDVSISRYESCACHYKRTCQREGSWCLATISVDDVTSAIRKRIGRS